MSDGWGPVRLKYLVSCHVDRADGNPKPFVALEHIAPGTGALIGGFEWEERASTECITFCPGDILFGKLRPYLRKCLIADRHGVCQTELLVLRPMEPVSGPFVFYLVQSSAFIAAAELSSYGVKMPRTSWEALGNTRVPCPERGLQDRIVAFLDRETARIDALIEKKERLIGLLEEKRAALIHRAVTQGLDPSVPMKPSGVDWIGEIPSHWSVWKLSHAFREIGSGTTPPTDRTEYYDGDVPWVTTTELRENLITETTVTLTSRALREFPTLQLYPPGTLLIAMYGATIGRLALLSISATTNQACCALADSDVFDTRFSFYWLHAFRDPLVAAAAGGGQPNINQQKIAALRIPAPPLAEQREIVQHLDSETARVEPVIRKNRHLIGLLDEYRVALISAAVTGQIDVGQPPAAGGEFC